MKHASKRLFLALPLCCALAACSAGPGGDTTVMGTENAQQTAAPSFARMAPTPPPMPQVEIKPWPPTDPWLVAWRRGYWDWNGLDFIWVPGEYIPKPVPSAIWSGDRWEKRKFGWVFVPGTWE
ncbi:MAG: hypothetical protein GC131_03855 [Alphaproteobacteria bacterium]|nr:hypothetical protein [Alphaproteobacteria bacterium]